ncbi:MAG: hypothetical protein ABEJ35_04705 [Halobacteriaceae archaeon]
MRRKPVPDPAADVTLAAAQAAVPLVPQATDDCCARLVARTGVPSADAARAWLTFMQALGLVRETEDGFVRTDRDPATAELAEAFLDGVYGAREVVDVVEAADAPLDATAVHDRLDIVPRWEGYRDGDPETTWRRRVGALLAWAARFELVTATEDGYRRLTPA